MTDPAPEKPAVPYTTIKAGDTVVYTPAFLASTGVSRGDPMWFARGTVTSADTERFARVDWHDGEDPMLVNKANIAKPLTAASVDLPVWYNDPKKPSGPRSRK